MSGYDRPWALSGRWAAKPGVDEVHATLNRPAPVQYFPAAGPHLQPCGRNLRLLYVMPFCSDCGEGMTDSARFCAGCGRALSAAREMQPAATDSPAAARSLDDVPWWLGWLFAVLPLPFS